MTVTHNRFERADLKVQVPRSRTILGSLLLALAVTAALVAGGWGVISSVVTGAPPATVGESVEVPGGLLRVDKVTPEHMVPMQSSKFSASGMSMSATGMDMAPKGYERFVVDITLIAKNGGLEYSPDDFRLSGEGVKDHAPVRAQLTEGTVEAGSAVSGGLVFQASENAKNLTVNFDGGRGISLDLPANDGGHSQSGGSLKGGNDH